MPENVSRENGNHAYQAACQNWLMAGRHGLCGRSCLGQPAAVVAAQPTKDAADSVAQKLDNATCQTCHDGKKGKLEVLGSNGEKRAVQKVNARTNMARACTPRWSASPATRKSSTASRRTRRRPAWPKAECAQCHLDLWEATKKDNKAAEKPRLGIVADNVAAYRKSFHAKPDKDDPTKLMAICSDCHNVHTFDVPPRGTQERKEWHLAVPDGLRQMP
jgi:hypothetical protein